MWFQAVFVVVLIYKVLARAADSDMWLWVICVSGGWVRFAPDHNNDHNNNHNNDNVNDNDNHNDNDDDRDNGNDNDINHNNNMQ